MGFSLQANRKTFEGKQSPYRNAQFEYLNAEVRRQLEKGNPVISVDTKKKELVGNFKNGGAEWHPKGKPDEVNVYDFPSLAEGRANPYGVYDLKHNEAWVNVGVDKDTAEFSIESIRRWWKNCGSLQYENASELLITADSGGSNGSRITLLQNPSDFPTPPAILHGSHPPRHRFPPRPPCHATKSHLRRPRLQIATAARRRWS